MYTFGQLCVGDLFNTNAARWVKASSSEAIVVLSGCVPLGDRVPISQGMNVVLLWSSLLSDDPSCSERKSEQPNLSESEKEDRFYRKIEAEIDAEHRERQAAEFRQCLIDERDALKARRIAMVPYLQTLNPQSMEYRMAKQQEVAMVEYLDVLYRRIDRLERPALQTV